MPDKSINEVAEVMHQLFSGKRESYALRFMKADGKKQYMPARDETGRDLPFDVEACKQHLRGETSIGSYAFIGSDTIQWFVIDFDGKNRGNILEDALAVKQALLRNLSLTSWMEKSQSGKGIHLWIFFDQPIQAFKLQGAVSPYIPELKIPPPERKTSLDMYIPEATNRSGKYGQLCALPLNGPSLVKEGKMVFITDTGEPYPNQSELLFKILSLRNSTAAIEEIVAKMPTVMAPKYGTQKKQLLLAGGIKTFSKYGCNWLHRAFNNPNDVTEEEWHAALTQFTRLEDGEELAHIFSSGYDGYSKSATQRKYEQALAKSLPMKCSTVQNKVPGACGDRCVCQELNLEYPYQIAKVPIAKLAEAHRRGIVHTSKDLATTAIRITKDVAKGNRLGFPWGYDILDDATELRPKDLIIVAARRSVGKTAVMIDVSIRGAMRGIPQYLFSMEMSSEQLALRFLARVAEVDHTLITTGGLEDEDWEKIFEAEKELSKLPIYVDDFTRDADRVLDSAASMVFRHGPGVVWLDYLQLTRQVGRETRKETIDRSLLTYRLLANVLEVPFIALAQLNRMEEQAEGEDDLDSWLKDSGNIEQDADVIMYLRGKLGPGTIARKWRIHKERHRASGLNFKFDFDQRIFKLTPAGLWTAAGEEDGRMMFELGSDMDFLSDE